jgi:hypothetical protein
MSNAASHNSSLTHQQIQTAALVASKIAADTTAANMGASTGSEARGIMMERTLHMNITNTLGNLALAGPHGGHWNLVDGKQPELLANMDNYNLDACAATSQLNNAIIHEVTLLEHQSTFPVPLGVTISCVPPREITDIGEKFAYTVLPNAVSSNSETIYKAESLSDDMYDWHKQFPKYNASNLETEGILPVNNQPFVFIEDSHPVLAVLRINPQLIGCDIDQQKKMGDYHRISRQLLQTCCNVLRQRVLSKISSHDLNTLSLQIHRINAESWEDLGDGSLAMRNLKLKSSMSPEEEEEAKRKHLRKFTQTPYSYMARIKIKYELPNMISQHD